MVPRKGRPASSPVTSRIPVPASSSNSGTAAPSAVIARQEV